MTKDWVTPEMEIQEETIQESNDTPDIESRYKEASDTISKMGESLLKANIEIAEVNPKKILDMDTKMQNKVIKHKYGLDNLEELKLIHGDTFYEDKSKEEEIVDETEELRKRLKLLEIQNEKWAVNRAIENFKIENKNLFERDESAVEKLMEEMKYLSDSLSPEERVKRASKIVFSSYVDSSTQAYLDIQEKTFNKKWGTSKTDDNKEEQKDETSEIFDSIISSQKRKDEYLRKFK